MRFAISILVSSEFNRIFTFVCMLHKLHIRNFKAWQDTGDIRMAPLTIFCGTNSSGKSSISQFLMMLKQTAESYDRKRVLHLGDEDSWVDLGTFKDIIHNHNIDKPLSFGFEIDTPRIKVEDAVKNEIVGEYFRLHFNAAISFDTKKERSNLKSFEYRLINDHNLWFRLLNRGSGKFKLETENYKAVRQKGRAWNLPHPENFFGFPDEAIAYYQNTGFLQDLSLTINQFLKSIYYVGPLREYPERIYQFSGEEPLHVGDKGTLAINSILASRGRKISRGYKKKKERFEELIARWLQQMELIHTFNIKRIGRERKEYEVRIKVHEDSPEVLITDVGFGISQVLPVVVQAFYALPGSIQFFEQPEIHLHPSVQAHLGDLFIEAIHAREDGAPKNTQIIVESHSEHLIRRIQRRIAEGVLKPEEVAIYFIRQKKGTARMEELEIDPFGNINNWPENFFGDETQDLVEMTKAAIERKKDLSSHEG